MTPQEARIRLHDTTLLLGRFRRRAAIRVLALDDDAGGVCILAEALARGYADQDRIESELARLSSAREPDKVVELWRHWADTPSPVLGRVLTKLGWPAGRPVAATTAAAVTLAARHHGSPDVQRAAWVFWSAVDGLAASPDTASVRILVAALGEEAPHADRIAASLGRLSAERDADLLRDLWRDWSTAPKAVIGELLAGLGWPRNLAVDPQLAIRVLAIVKADSPAGVVRAVAALAAALPRSDAAINDQIYQAWVRSQSADLEQLIADQQRGARTPTLSALHALATGRLEAYDELGDEGSKLLTAAYALAPELLRARMDTSVAVLARRASDARARTFSLPAGVADLYPRNPYAVLGLRPLETSTRSLLRRRDDLLTLLAAGIPVEQRLAGFVSVKAGSPMAVSERDVTHATARLQNEPDRYRQALLWFQLTDEPNDVLSALASGEFDNAERSWLERSRTMASQALGCRALYNLAVLAHWRAIAAEQGGSAPDATPAAAAWTASLDLWRRVLDTPGTWGYFERLIAGATDPRIDAGFLARLQGELPASILGVNLEIARAAADAGLARTAAAHVRLVEESGFAKMHVEGALDEFFASHLSAARRALQPLVLHAVKLTEEADFGVMAAGYRKVRDRLAMFDATSRLRSLAEEAVSSGRRRLLDETNAAYARFNESDTTLWQDISDRIEEWNSLMDRHNSGHSHASALKALFRALDREGSEALTGSSARVDEFAEVVRREQLGFELLLLVDPDAGNGCRGEIEALVESEREAVRGVREDYHKTREFFEKTIGDLRRSCSSL